MDSNLDTNDVALIAVFMDIKETELTYNSYGIDRPIWKCSYLDYTTPTYNIQGKSLKHLLQCSQFDKSWDWLMPVYRKIRDIINERAKYDKHTRTAYDLIELDIQCAVCEVNVEKAYGFIIDFIKCWNSTQVNTVNDVL